MDRTTVRKAIPLGIIAITSLFATQANADPIFTFTQYGGFADVVAAADYFDPITGDVSVVPVLTPLYSTMAWVAGNSAQSSLELDTVEEDTGLAFNTWTTISTLTHNNFIIPFALNWSGQTIWGRFKISDADGGSSVVLDDTSAVTVALTETSNAGICPTPNPVGSACDDFFTFEEVGLGDLFFTANDSSQWMASFRFANFVNAAIVDGVIYTGEATSSSVDVQVMITSLGGPVTVPEPTTLGILGLGLVGLSLVKRRKQNG